MDDRMSPESYSTTITVDRPAREVFDVINDPRVWWWSDLDGQADEIGAVFVFDSRPDHIWRFRVTELVPAEKVVWRVFDSETGFVEDRDEWNDTEITFELSETDGATSVRFTHVGLTPDLECFDSCSAGWTGYITDSLARLLTAGQGRPGAY